MSKKEDPVALGREVVRRMCSLQGMMFDDDAKPTLIKKMILGGNLNLAAMFAMLDWDKLKKEGREAVVEGIGKYIGEEDLARIGGVAETLTRALAAMDRIDAYKEERMREFVASSSTDLDGKSMGDGIMEALRQSGIQFRLQDHGSHKVLMMAIDGDGNAGPLDSSGLRAGDEVVLGRHDPGEDGRPENWNDRMERFVGKKTRIVELGSDGNGREMARVEVDEEHFAWYTKNMTRPPDDDLDGIFDEIIGGDDED